MYFRDSLLTLNPCEAGVIIIVSLFTVFLFLLLVEILLVYVMYHTCMYISEIFVWGSGDMWLHVAIFFT